MIIANNVTKRFGRLKVLDDFSATCSKGECIALMGPNGSGKTTFLKIVLGMVVCDSGFISFNGKSIWKEWDYRAQIGYMPQIGRYPENMTIGQLFRMMKDIRGIRSAAELDESLPEQFGISAIQHKRMGTLSGGTRQKISACLAFLFKPDVLILDEPTAGLDPVSVEILKNKIREEKQNGKLVLITSHVLSELDDLVTELMYLQDGKLQFHKTLEQLRKDTGEERLSRAIAQVMQ
jgi:Cu-processing system ATP-binding protein